MRTWTLSITQVVLNFSNIFFDCTFNFLLPWMLLDDLCHGLHQRDFSLLPSFSSLLHEAEDIFWRTVKNWWNGPSDRNVVFFIVILTLLVNYKNIDFFLLGFDLGQNLLVCKPINTSSIDLYNLITILESPSLCRWPRLNLGNEMSSLAVLLWLVNSEAISIIAWPYPQLTEVGLVR